ncbi:MAG: helix-turn-helix domain-containing protein [Prevotella sp.]|nr:helix-turn-helix domain-containing protein [Prevotella sp.]
MKQQHAVLVLFALIIASSLTSLGSYRSTSQKVIKDMDRALAITMQEQQSDVISQDTIRTFNSHLQITALRGKATLAVDTRSKQFKAYAHCSEATIFSLSDQRPAALLWMLTGCWAMFLFLSEKLRVKSEESQDRRPEGEPSVAGRREKQSQFSGFGGLTYSETEGRFYAIDGNEVQLTPMQRQLLTMFFLSPSHSLSKAEICDALWPKKPDASDTLYTLIRRLKPVIERYSDLKIESDRSKAYRLTIKKIEN